jgi:hypothetical protein
MRLLACLLMLLPLLAEERGGRAEYVGGTVAALPGKTAGVILTTGGQFMRFRTKAGSVHIPYAQVNLLEYGQKVERRYVLAILVSPVLLFSKKRQHFLTVGYTDEEGRQQALIFRLDKGDVRSVLVSLEVKTGRKVEYQDEEARKAGKG